MRDIKFKVYYQHEDTGYTTYKVVNLGEPIPYLGDRWYIISKCQYTGLKDKYGTKMFDGDIVQDMDKNSPRVGVIKYGVYEHMDGEYYPTHMGFYTQWLTKGTPDDTKQNELFNYLQSWNLIVIGNILENKELLDG